MIFKDIVSFLIDTSHFPKKVDYTSIPKEILTQDINEDDVSIKKEDIEIIFFYREEKYIIASNGKSSEVYPFNPFPQQKIMELQQSSVNDFKFTLPIINKLDSNIGIGKTLTSFSIQIKNGEIITNFSEKKHALAFRVEKIIDLVKKSIAYFNKYDIEFPDSKIWIFPSDVYYWDDQSLPYCVFCRPKNKKGILFPDDSFLYHKIGKKEVSFEETTKECSSSPSKKIDKIYFKGGQGDRNNASLRKNLMEYSHIDKSLPMKIDLNSKFVSLCSFSKYKYLLNLPGRQPWSYRLKYLFLQKSLVIDISLIQRYILSDGSVDINSEWINFYSPLLEKEKDYIFIPMEWEEGNVSFNEESFDRVITSLKETFSFFESNPKKYSQVVESGYSKIKTLTMEEIYKSIYCVFFESNRKMKEDGVLDFL